MLEQFSIWTKTPHWFNILTKKIRTSSIWATHDKTNKMAYVPSKDSDQPGHLPSLIWGFAVRMKKAWVLSYPLCTAKTLIRLLEYPGWSESLLVAQSFFWFCHEMAHMNFVIYINLQNDLCSDQRLGSACPSTHQAPSEASPAQADLRLLWAHKRFCLLCLAMTQNSTHKIGEESSLYLVMTILVPL